MPDDENDALAHQLPCHSLGLARLTRIVHLNIDNFFAEKSAFFIKMFEGLLSSNFLLFPMGQVAAGQGAGDTNLDLGLSRCHAANHRYECAYQYSRSGSFHN
jgi:hypothetical protein